MDFIKEEKKVEQNTDWLDDPKETILIYGKPKVGKTAAYMSIVEDKLKTGSNIFFIDTDNGLVRTLRWYFGDNLKQYKDKLNYFFISNIEQIYDIVPEIKSKVKKNDIIVVDLVSEFWEMAQTKFMEELSGDNPIGFVAKASKDPGKFGLFEGQKWNYIKKIDNYILDNLILRPPCKMVIGVCAGKDIDVEKTLTKKKTHEYDSAGVKPSGQPMLPFKFDTIVYIGKMNDKRYFQILGHRGKEIKPNMNTYERNFYDKFKEVVKDE